MTNLPVRIREWFPLLDPAETELTSPQDGFYNCFAHAAGDNTHWWQPLARQSVYWPPGVPLKPTLDAYQEAFGTIGYVPCANGDLEIDVEKIAIFVDERDLPIHAARQLVDGSWTSKLGDFEDIRHRLDQLTGPEPAYGRIAAFMSRQRTSTVAPK